MSIAVPLLEQWDLRALEAAGGHSQTPGLRFRWPCREAVWRHGLCQQPGEKGPVVSQKGDLMWLGVGP